MSSRRSLAKRMPKAQIMLSQLNRRVRLDKADIVAPKFLQGPNNKMKTRRNDDNPINRSWQNTNILEYNMGRRVEVSYPKPKTRSHLSRRGNTLIGVR